MQQLKNNVYQKKLSFSKKEEDKDIKKTKVSIIIII
jgi:hypothetical protein